MNWLWRRLLGLRPKRYAMVRYGGEWHIWEARKYGGKWFARVTGTKWVPMTNDDVLIARGFEEGEQL